VLILAKDAEAVDFVRDAVGSLESLGVRRVGDAAVDESSAIR
jgi:hypothetical protein